MDGGDSGELIVRRFSCSFGIEACQTPWAAIHLWRFIAPSDELPNIPRPDIEVHTLSQIVLNGDVLHNPGADEIIGRIQITRSDPDFGGQTNARRSANDTEEIQ